MDLADTIISSVEFHGKISLVFFLEGCPLRCPYCHNWEILNSQDKVSIETAYKKIDDAIDFIDAVDVSGGEPLKQCNDTIKILKYAHNLGLKTKIDTSGVYPEKLEEILKLNILDYVAMDIKAPFNKYEEIIGLNIGENVKKSMNIVNKYPDVYFECRTTYVPTLLTEEDIENIATSIKCDTYTIQQFRNRNVLDEKLKKIEDPNPNILREIAKNVKPILNNTIIKVKTAEFGEEIIQNL